MSASAKNLSHNCVLATSVGHGKMHSVKGAYLKVGELHTVLRVVSFAQEEVP